MAEAQEVKAIPEILKSDACEGEILDREKMFEEAWWLSYCCCAGHAVGSVKPCFGAEVREFCIHSKCEQVECGNPFCSSTTVECCITSQCAFPKIEGSPTCTCCNKTLAGGDNLSNWKPKLFDYEFKFADSFWIYYFLCAGVSVHAPRAAGRPLLGAQGKEFCIKFGEQCVTPMCPEGEGGGGVWCSGLGTVCCFYTQVQYPPVKTSPKIACCGWRMQKDNVKGKPKPMGYGAPAMQEMK